MVHTPCLPKTAIHGSTSWISNVPLIQLNGRYKRNDIFWFTFFHKVGHILLHGKKYISIENIKYKGENQEYEEEANRFASNYILTDEQVEEIKNKPDLDENDIISFAKKIYYASSLHNRQITASWIHQIWKGIKFFEPINFYN